MSDKLYQKIFDIVQDQQKAEAILQLLQQEQADQKQQKAKLQAEGIAAAKERGVKFGRPQKPVPKNFEKVYRLYRSGALTVGEAIATMGISRASFHRLVKRYEQQEGIRRD